MASVVSREAYFEIGLEVLADVGYGGLKLAVVCNRLGVTTGSFYHYFFSWGHYTRALIEYWLGTTRERVAVLRSITDPHKRLERLMHIGLNLSWDADAAIRTWASMDPDVRAAQVEVDFQRFDIIVSSVREITGDERQAKIFAECAVFLLTGYEQSTLPHKPDDLGWMFRRLTDSLNTDWWGDGFTPDGAAATIASDEPGDDG